MQERGHISAAQLAAYHDGQLAHADADRVRAHASYCDECRDQLEAMDRVDRAVLTLDEPKPTRDLWPGVEAALGSHRAPMRSAMFLLRSPARRWAAAAVVAAMLIGGLLALGPLQNVLHAPGQTAERFGFDYGSFLTGLNQPDKMERFERAYQRRQLTIEEALSAVDVSVDRDLLERIPAGLDLKAVYILSNQTARAVQISYARSGSEISVFKQPEGLPVRFAGYRIEPAAIGSKKCLMVDTGRFCAITFSADDGQYVVIGRNDDMRVARLIDELLATL